MKKVFLAMTVALISLTTAAQQAGCIPPVNPNIDSMLRSDTAMQNRYNADSSVINRSWKQKDSTGWERDNSTQSWNKDSSLSGWNKHDSIMKRQADSTYLPKRDSSHMDRTTDSTSRNEKLSDRAFMKDGEMMLIKNGVRMKMEKDLTLPSGTTIKTDGTVIKKIGSETKLKDGQYISLPAAADKKKTAPNKNKAGTKKTMKVTRTTTVSKTKQ